MGKILGLDLGITSVGYGIISEEDYKIIDYGCRLFDERDVENNKKRRATRSARRGKSRNLNRRQAIRNYLRNIGIIDDAPLPNIIDIYQVRVKGLSQKLTNIELANVLIHIAKHRGTSLNIALDESDKEQTEMVTALTNNTRELNEYNWYVCESQYNKIKNGETVRGHRNLYRTEDYIKEVRKILSNQNLSEEQNNKIISIIERRRNYAEGPGSFKFPSKYGSYRLVRVEGKDKVIKVNLIEEMRGKCSLFPDEPRIAKNTYKACLFNLLNDLNNISYIRDGETVKMTTSQKQSIIDEYINIKGKITPHQLAKYLKVNKEEISGFRLDKKKNPLLTSFDAYIKFIKCGLSKEFLLDTDKLDTVIEILTKTLVIDQRVVEITALGYDLSSEDIHKIASLSKISEYHSLSKKAMDILIPEMLATEKNQMQIIQENHLNKKEIKYKGFNILFDSTAILSGVARRVHQQALKVVNDLRRKYGEFSAIVIETTREKNSLEQRNKISEQQKKNLAVKEKTNNLLLDLGKNPEAYNTITKLKVSLYHQQNGKTMYAGLPIDLNTLLSDPTAYQIEHIIPYAISFDNSLNNKCLVSLEENQRKGRTTPWMYFSSGKAIGPNDTFEKYKFFVESLHLSKTKKENLLNQDNISKFDNLEKFRNRNLVDTSYAIRSVMSTLKDYFTAHEIDTKVFTIRGKVTNDFRNRVGLTKDRDKFIHHAVDALIIAGAKNQALFKKAFDYTTDSSNRTTDLASGEWIDFANDPFADNNFLRFVKGLKSLDDSPVHFSYKVDKKANRLFSDETIYSTRRVNNIDYVVKKYKDIYGKEGIKLANLFSTNQSHKLLMAKNDTETYNVLKLVYESYPKETNPFAKYYEEHGPIRKYSKKGNGPFIHQVKYIEDQLKNHIDITSKYCNGITDPKNKKIVLLQLKPYRTDVYISEEGQYKFLTVRSFHVKIVDNKHYIDQGVYEHLKEAKKITSKDKFLFSLHRNNIINLVFKKDIVDSNLEDCTRLYRFISTNSDASNTIECRLITEKTPKQMMLTIGRSCLKFEKYNVSSIGQYKIVEMENLKLTW